MSYVLPENLKPYKFLGLDLNHKEGDKNATTDCLFCDREDKFNISQETGQYRCWVCGEKGNVFDFIQKLHAISFKATTAEAYQYLANNRGLLDSLTLLQWNLAQSVLTKDWISPAFGTNYQKMSGMYRYIFSKGRTKWLPTPSLGHRLFTGGVWSPNVEIVYLCEGIWDAMAVWEVLNKSKFAPNGKLVPTSNPSASLSKIIGVAAIPACEVFSETWMPYFRGKNVVLMAHNDHPRKHPTTGEDIPSASYTGMKKIAQVLQGEAAGVSLLRWGEETYNLNMKSGWDLRDYFSGDLDERVAKLESLPKLIQELPATWKTAIPQKSKGRNGRGEESNLTPCDNYRELITTWRKALKWTYGLERGLTAMLASSISTMSVGDQLWVKVIGPASCGKSTLCEAISTNKRYVFAKSTIRGFHSGWREEGEEDSSLISKINGCTLVTKDGDTLLQSPNLGQILSEARDIYDCVSRSHYRNNAGKDYEGVRMTWVLCGTSSLRSLDSSELGERFLDCVVMEDIDDDLEDEILWRVANRAKRVVGIEASGAIESQQDPAMVLAMTTTGGYIEHLRTNAVSLLSNIEVSDQAIRKCTRFGKFIAFMRARPSKIQDEDQQRELAARLVSQCTRMAICTAAVMSEKEVTSEVLKRVQAIALDTGRGMSLKIADLLSEDGDGLESRAIAVHLNKGEDKIRTMLRFLREIGAVELNKEKRKDSSQYRYRLTKKFRALYEEVMDL